MSRSWIAALTIAGLLAMPPLALKIRAYRLLSAVDTSRETRALDFLLRNGFVASKGQSPDPQFFLIHARRDGCLIDLREVSPRGYDRSAMKALAVGQRLVYVDNGAVSSEQPAWRNWSYLYLRRFATFMGWPVAKRMTFAVISSPSCADLDWSELSKHVDADVATSSSRWSHARASRMAADAPTR